MNWIIEAIGRLFGYHLDDEQMLRAQLKEAREELIEATARCEEWDARRTMFAKRIARIQAQLGQQSGANAS